jgi:prepilin-type N-terminal cleavage/methylation domain-containing protein/prepilin-type processing-associated H-X9-DG protein
MSPRRRRAFTLVELLTVLFIVALLMAVLLPALSKAREQAKATACLSNLRQLGVALTAYQNAYRNEFPADAHSGWGGGASWVVTLYPFGATPGVRLCPSEENRTPDPAITSYGINGLMAPKRVDPPPYTKVTRVRRPSATVYATELVDLSLGDHFHPEAWTTVADLETKLAVRRHRGQPNALYCDGHAAPLPHALLLRHFPGFNPFDPARAQ